MDSINPDPAHIPDTDLNLRGYQDAFDTDETISDEATHDLTDDPAKELGVPPEELAKELDKYDFENGSHDGTEPDGEGTPDDRREEIESRDMDTDEND